MAEQHLLAKEDVSVFVEVAYERWEKQAKEGKETHTRFALMCGPNIFGKLIDTVINLLKMLQSKLCISTVMVCFRRGYEKNTHSTHFNIISST